MDKLNLLFNQLRLRARAWRLQRKELTVENNNNTPMVYTEEQLMARLKFFIGICLSLTLFGIVFVVLYSLIFVTQPLNAISPIDQKFFELIVPIATFLTGTLSGIMLAGNNPEAQQKALDAANKGWDRPPTPTPTNGGMPNGGFAAPSVPQTGFGSAHGGFSAPAAEFGGAFGGMVGAVATTSSGKAIVPDFPQPLI
jgi:hypothetical protein